MVMWAYKNINTLFAGRLILDRMPFICQSCKHQKELECEFTLDLKAQGWDTSRMHGFTELSRLHLHLLNAYMYVYSRCLCTLNRKMCFYIEKIYIRSQLTLTLCSHLCDFYTVVALKELSRSQLSWVQCDSN